MVKCLQLLQSGKSQFLDLRVSSSSVGLVHNLSRMLSFIDTILSNASSFLTETDSERALCPFDTFALISVQLSAF